MLGKLITAFTAAIIISAPAYARTSLTNTMIEFGKQRTALFAVLTEKPHGGFALADKLSYRMGLNGNRSSAMTTAYRYITLEPLLRYDHNTNGGMTAHTIYISGLPFVISESSRAVSEVTAGGRLLGGIGFTLGHGSVLSFDGSLGYRRGLEHGFNIRERSARVSLTQNFENWSYMSLSHSFNVKDVKLSTDRKATTSFTYGKVFGDKDEVHDVSATFSRAKEGNHYQNRIGAKWEGGYSRGDVFKAGLELGQSVRTAHLPKWTAEAGYSTMLFKKAFSINASYTNERGSNFMNRIRNDDVRVLQANYAIKQNFTINVSIEHRKSTIHELSDTKFNMWFSLPALRL